MSGSRATMDVKGYYRTITAVDIGSIARELLGDRVQDESAHLLRCDCPHHTSESKQSLHVMLDKQGWYCFGCGVGGDVLQLVEFVQSGQVTRGTAGAMPESHGIARDFLAERAGVPPLSAAGLSAEEVAEAEERRAEESRVRESLTTIAELYHERLMNNPEVLEWLRTNYAISEETIQRLTVGYADIGDREIVKILRGAPYGIHLHELAATGAFLKRAEGGLRPFFNHRVIFPYWNRGRVVYMIGRRTPWTEDHRWEKAKYKKLPVRNDDRQYISPSIKNAWLYNEDCLSARPDRVVLTEGVTDCIALMERGFPTVSPVTVTIRKEDWNRLIPRLRGVNTVYLCQDNEPSRVGLEGALKTASILSKHDIEARLVTLPLGEEQQDARAKIKKWQEEKPEEGVPPELLGAAKIDVNEYFLSGHSAAEFEELLSDARTPLERSVRELSSLKSESDCNKALEPILEAVTGLPPLQQDWYLRLIQKECKERKISLGVLRDQVRGIRGEKKKHVKARKPVIASPSGSCLAAVEEAAHTSDTDYAEMAETAFRWMGDNGAQFFRSPDGTPFLFFDNQIYWMDTADRGRRRLYYSLMYDLTGVVHTTTGGRVFYEVMANLAAKHGKPQDRFSWLHTDVTKQTVYFCLNNADHEIAKITPDGVETMPNGGNEDGVILESSKKMKPIRFLPDADLDEADRLMSELIVENLACPVEDRQLIVSWLSCFLLLDYAGTRPMTRFEGAAASGKTTASKLISALLYGEPQQKKSTDAANYTDGSQNPLIVLDNIEVRQLTEELSTFFLTCITGIAKEKRKGGTDTETVVERTKCLLNTTGIEPLGGGQSEVLSRSLIIRFDRKDQGSDCFLEAKLLAAIKEHRDLILSALMNRTGHVLAMIRDGAQERCMALLKRELGDHTKARCNDFLSLMYLVGLAGMSAEDREDALTNLQPRFQGQIESLNDTSGETARESNQLVTGLTVLFNAYREAAEADEKFKYRSDSKTNVEAFYERYQIRFSGVDKIEGAMGRELFIALTRLSGDFRFQFLMVTPQQFYQRFSNDLDVLREAGFVVEIEDLGNRRRAYDIRKLDDRIPF